MSEKCRWQAYRVILRLHSPLHIGWGKVSYLQRTRPYVTGRVLRGALVNRVGRNQNIRGTDPLDPFRCVSKTFASYLTYTYFYPALENGDDWQVQFPWEDESAFRRQFLSSYAGTALEYPQQTAAEGLLREIEFISPYTLDTGEPVYLIGYVFAKDECLKKYDWRGAFQRLQLGGERGYGWGAVSLACEIKAVEPDARNQISLFDQEIGFEGSGATQDGGTRPRLIIPPQNRTWAHVAASEKAAIAGLVEPVVGREWRAEGNKKGKRKHIGQHLAFDDVYFAPGSLIPQETPFSIEEGGYWRSGEAR